MISKQNTWHMFIFKKKKLGGRGDIHSRPVAYDHLTPTF